MSDTTAISWCDSTFNPWEGCQKVGPGCDHCYAETRNARYAGGQAVNWGPGAPRRRTSVGNWNLPLRWEREHAAFYAEHGRRRRVFCASLADVFDNAVDPAWRRDLFDLIELTPNLDWLLLTKRIGNVQEMVRIAKSGDWLAGQRNVWLGATVVNQEEADRDIPKLAAVRARVRFLSIEPMLGPVNLRLVTKTWSPGRCNHCCNGDRCDDPSHYDRQRCPHCHGTGGQPISQVICGGESGPGARPMLSDWARDIKRQCEDADVPFHLKQHGEWVDASTSAFGQVPAAEVRYLRPDGSEVLHGSPDWQDENAMVTTVARVGKKAAGRLLDGVEHNGFPGA